MSRRRTLHRNVAKLIVETPEGVQIRQDLAGAGSRFAAALIDSILFGIVVLVLLILVAIAASVGSGSGIEGFLLGLLIGGVVLLGIAYPFLWHAFNHGQTPGKRMLGIRVLSADGSPASTVQHLLRSLILVVDILPVPVPLWILLAAIMPRHTRLGDLAAGTLVLRVVDAERVRDRWPNETWSALPERRLALDARAAASLDPRDVAFLRDVVTREDLDPAAQKVLVERTANAYCKKMGVELPTAFVNEKGLVREIYLFAREFVGTTARA